MMGRMSQGNSLSLFLTGQTFLKQLFYFLYIYFYIYFIYIYFCIVPEQFHTTKLLVCTPPVGHIRLVSYLIVTLISIIFYGGSALTCLFGCERVGGCVRLIFFFISYSLHASAGSLLTLLCYLDCYFFTSYFILNFSFFERNDSFLCRVFYSRLKIVFSNWVINYFFLIGFKFASETFWQVLLVSYFIQFLCSFSF